jgi:hypothetical protein
MAGDGTFRQAKSVLTQLGDHTKQSARRFLGRCKLDEARAIAACKSYAAFEEVIERILDRLEMIDKVD